MVLSDSAEWQLLDDTERAMCPNSEGTLSPLAAIFLTSVTDGTAMIISGGKVRLPRGWF